MDCGRYGSNEGDRVGVRARGGNGGVRPRRYELGLGGRSTVGRAFRRAVIPMLCIALLAACGGDRDPRGSADGRGADGEPHDGLVEIHVLRAALPDSLPGMERIRIGGERGGIAGAVVSRAIAEYVSVPGDRARSVRLEITDLGALSGDAVPGQAWMLVEIDHESETGYERTTSYLDHPAFERFTQAAEGTHAELQVVVARRFVVEAIGRGVDPEHLRMALGHLDLEELSQLPSGQ